MPVRVSFFADFSKAERLVVDTNVLNSAQNFGLIKMLPAIWTIHDDI